MSEALATTRTQLARQIAHWTIAIGRLQNLEELAAPAAWIGLERYLGVSLRQHLSGVVAELQRHATLLRATLDAAASAAELERVRRQLLAFRTRILRAEITLDFYTDAINTRTNPTIAALLRACDTLAYRSMAQVLDQLDTPVPVVLTYLDKGLGASILKAGLRLWDGSSESPAAAIKIVRHNLHRPTSLLHEAGHQVAHSTGWNGELAAMLERELDGAPAGLAGVWSGWTSELSADAFAFAHTGYAAVATLHDVLAGAAPAVFRDLPGDPHPISYIRVLLGVEMCRQFYGAGPWDALAAFWVQSYPLSGAPQSTRLLLQGSLPLLPAIVDVTLRRPMRAFAGRPLSALVNPQRVQPATLERLEQQLGAALYSSTHWIWTEALRLLALSGLRAATMPERAAEIFTQQERWMLRLGDARQAA